MKVLLDHNMPVQLRRGLQGHLAMSTRAMGWDLLKNGDLIRVAENAGFEVLLTADQKMFREQSHLDRRIALVVLSRSERRVLEPALEIIRAAVNAATPGSYQLVKILPEAGQPTLARD